MNHDNDMRRQSPPSFLVARGHGMALRFLCPLCSTAKRQEGGKRLRIKGVPQLLCKDCVAARGAPKAAP